MGTGRSKSCPCDWSSSFLLQWNSQHLRMNWCKSSKSITWGMCLLLNLLVCVSFSTQGPPPWSHPALQSASHLLYLCPSFTLGLSFPECEPVNQAYREIHSWKALVRLGGRSLITKALEQPGAVFGITTNYGLWSSRKEAVSIFVNMLCVGKVLPYMSFNSRESCEFWIMMIPIL